MGYNFTLYINPERHLSQIQVKVSLTMKSTDTVTEWVKFGTVNFVGYIGKDVVYYGSGCHVKFYNMVTEELLLYTATHPDLNGDGIKTMGGHRSILVFAHAEFCKNSDLIVKTYPDFQIVQKFTEGPLVGYKAIEFAESALLIALGDMPSFTIFVLNWCTGERYAEHTNHLFLEHQLIRVGWSRPIFVCQLAKDTKRFIFWTILTCCKHSILDPQDVKMDPKEVDLFTDVIFTTDDTFFMTDIKGCVYTIDSNYILRKIICCSEKGDFTTQVAWYKGGLAVSGPDPIIRHYIKTSDVWTIDWTIVMTDGLKILMCNRTDLLIGVDSEDVILVISDTNGYYPIANPPRMQARFEDFCLIHPWSECVLVLSEYKLVIYDVVTGQYVTHWILDSPAVCLTGNSDYPYCAVGYSSGTIELVSLYDPFKLKKMATFHLCAEPIQKIRFFEEGRILVGGNTDNGKLFIIEGLPGTQMNVVACIEMNKQIADYMLVASFRCYRLFAIPIEAFQAGNKIVRYCIMSQDEINYKEYSVEDERQLYYALVPAPIPNRDRIFYALSLLSRDIHVLENKRGSNIIKLISIIKSGHQTRHINLKINLKFAITWSYDGFVIVRSSDFQDEIGMTFVHNRHLGGVQKATIADHGKYIISLGKDNALVGTLLLNTEPNPDIVRKNEELKLSDSFKLMFKRPTYGYVPDGRFTGMNWCQVQAILRAEKEARICRIERNNLLKEFNDIKTTLCKLVTENLEGPENEKIDLSEFYLDVVTYNHMRAVNKEECKEVEIILRATIVAQDNVSHHLQKNYLDVMDQNTTGRIVRGIFQPTMATNYTLLPPDPIKLRRLAWLEEVRKVQGLTGLMGKFEPWLPMTKEEVHTLIKSPIVIPTQDYSSIPVTLEMDDLHQRSQETQIALAGTVTSLYVDRSSGHFSQRHIVSFYQTDIQQTIAECEVTKLKLNYNKCFNATIEEKSREMESIQKRNARMRHIISEYNYFSPEEERIYIDIEDPVWTLKEQPWLISKVLDEEIPITPYISPSEQAILDARAAEEERIRLALLADDFRERALMAMMNGVLEIRWEDELRKEVPKPKCMLEKDPAQFNEDDIRAVKDYEEKVVFLHSERERYRILLDVEYGKVATLQRDNIRKFNARLRECVQYKMNIDSGMNQENLLVNRHHVREKKRIQYMVDEENIKANIALNEVFIAATNDKIRAMTSDFGNCKAPYEALQGKEKIMEKNFRRELLDLSVVVQEIALKLYKKRPKVTLKNINLPSQLNLLARAIGTGERPLGLSFESLEYLKSIDHLDQPIGLPAGTDDHVYTIIFKHRRLRLEYDCKLKSYQMMIYDCEVSLNILQQRVNFMKERNIQYANDITKVHNDYLYLKHNIQIQIVLRRGLVEIPLTGQIEDFDDAILIPKSEIHEVNKLIQAAGEKKLETIRRNMAFRRRIMATEWQHQRLRMTINDLIAQIEDINDIKINKDIQLYLRHKKIGKKVQTDTFEQEVEVLCMAYENAIREKIIVYKKLRKQIMVYHSQNKYLDKSIMNINFDVCNLNLHQDKHLIPHENELLQETMELLLCRTNLVKQIQENHQEILMLQTELEILRQKRNPTFEFNVVNDEP